MMRDDVALAIPIACTTQPDACRSGSKIHGAEIVWNVRLALLHSRQVAAQCGRVPGQY